MCSVSEDVCRTVRDLFREPLIGPILFVSAVCYSSYVLLTLPQTHFDKFRWIFSVPEKYDSSNKSLRTAAL